MIGPADRQSFFEVQARDRRASWKIAAVCLFGVAVMAAAQVLILTPPIVAAAILTTDAISLIIPATPNLVGIFNAGPQPLPAWMSLALVVGPGALIAVAATSENEV